MPSRCGGNGWPARRPRPRRYRKAPMKQLTLVEAGKVEWTDVPQPPVQGAGEALVRPLAVALCDLDANIVSGESPLQTPVALGHEFVAEVVEGADQVKSVSPGDRVAVPFQMSCG